MEYTFLQNILLYEYLILISMNIYFSVLIKLILFIEYNILKLKFYGKVKRFL
jgi:hypothetical protein